MQPNKKQQQATFDSKNKQLVFDSKNDYLPETSANNHADGWRPAKRSMLAQLNKRRRNLKARINEKFKRHSRSFNDTLLWDDMEYAERQNSVATLDLFKYAKFAERLAILAGVLFMLYAASWQPISVFILAKMAAIMGQYCKQTNWILQLNKTATDSTATAPINDAINLNFTVTSLAADFYPSRANLAQGSPLDERIWPPKDSNSISGQNKLPHDYATTADKLLAGATDGSQQVYNVLSTPQLTSNYENFSLLAPLYSIVKPIFDLGGSGAASESLSESEKIKLAVHDILQHESNQFLRESFNINGSAFLLALTQLLSFFIGMTLIIWAAKKQASRVKILYFNSCLHQEVTWFEAVDSASGSGSSLNALVEKYEDGIGMKLALLCYFLGHVTLFAMVAFYQMFKLASFCMPFVLLIGVIIAYLSEWQAIAIGQHALFAKRSLQLAEEILAAIRTVLAFNGQQKELTRFSMSLQPVYRRSLIKHLYTALNTSLSKFSIFACFSAYCFYAMRLFPPYDPDGPSDKSTVLAVMRGAEVSIVNILISIPFMEALQQSKGSIARIYASIERFSKIDPSLERGNKPEPSKWAPSISFRMVQFDYADRSGPTRRRSTLPFLNLPGSPGSNQAPTLDSMMAAHSRPNMNARRQSLIEEIADELGIERSIGVANKSGGNSKPPVDGAPPGSKKNHASTLARPQNNNVKPATHCLGDQVPAMATRKPSTIIKRTIGHEIDSRRAGQERILNYFNLEIKAGQSVALVGPSGSGKSTVLSLIQRLYDITGGQLFIGQHNIKDLNVSWLRNQIGVVTQEPRLFDMTIAENIRLGLRDDQDQEWSAAWNDAYVDEDLSVARKEAEIMQQVVEAAREASAHEFIIRLPNGYSTRVGSGGVQLSGGQKQRIAIARALIRKPKILLLDESTSALDTESESRVQQAIKQASVGRTTITVAHRLSTIKEVDMIVVMSQGQVVECGSHEELMALDSDDAEGGSSGAAIYKQMYEQQMRSMKRQPSAAALSPLLEETGEQVCSAASREQINAPEKKHASPLSRAAEFDEDEHTKINCCPIDDNEGADDCAISDVSDGDDDECSNDDDERIVGARPSAWALWQFIEMPKWSALSAVIICLLAGLILPLNLIAHSYLFSAFAYNELEQIGDYLHVFGLLILSFSTLVFIVSFLQVLLPGYVGEKLSIRLRVKIMDALLSKPMFYFDMDSNSAGSLCERFNSYISSLQSIAGARVAVMIEAVATLCAGAIFGFGQNLTLSIFCLSFALIVLATTIIESRIFQREASLQQEYDAKVAHLMADALSNMKTIASLNKEKFFIGRFTDLIRERENCAGRCVVWLRTFLTSLKFVIPAMSWSASMYYGCHLLVDGRIDLQTIFIVCPVVLFAVNDTFRALVFLPELLKARHAIERLYMMHREFSPQVLSMLTLGQQIEQQSRLYLEQQLASTDQDRRPSEVGGSRRASLNPLASSQRLVAGHTSTDTSEQSSNRHNSMAVVVDERGNRPLETMQQHSNKPKKSISFIVPQSESSISEVPMGGSSATPYQQAQHLINRRCSNLNALPSYMRRKSSRLNSLIPRTQARGRIEFKDVEFAYPNRPSALVLDSFTLSIAPGESVALVGGSGSGKSTAVAILEKFYDYHGGEVTLDGNDLRLVKPEWVRSQIGLVSQEPTLLSYTIGDNIRYGDNSRFVSMDEVVEAARIANIHDFIMSLPDQYDTELTNSTYSSSQLSGGQRQRIAIARALIRNAPILIFDEATSALDNRNESVVQDALNKARRGRTSLTIAHRLATIKDADKIVVLRDGKVVEWGRHEQLLRQKDSHYRSLWERQEGTLTDN